MFKLALDYRREQMAAYAQLQEEEFALARSDGFAATTHQRFVGTGYFDEVQKAIAGEDTPTAALTGSTEEAQFAAVDKPAPVRARPAESRTR